eukprot:c15724_g1_i1.p1 GENE.c15724_g1_i1~~c15724_g1_i1.p1  ORF type:complete len:103 (+),score=37.40 c15724_g1_i1:329-637(+)
MSEPAHDGEKPPKKAEKKRHPAVQLKIDMDPNHDTVAPQRVRLPVGKNPLLKPHRCNDHLQDFLDGFFEWPFNVGKPGAVYLSCLRSNAGQEPPRVNQQVNK